MEKYMRMALELAKKGAGKTNPNPMVGAVIVKNNKIISTGFHQKYGQFHAERNAILNCDDKEALKGAEMYVTLEPCCHHGKTPPCTDIIIKSGIKKVIIGCTDDNPSVNKKGIQILRNNGIEVITGVLEKECLKLNEIFFHYIKNNTPFVILKYAMTADGKIASAINDSKWITGEEARKNVHKTRNLVGGIMVGIGTVISDNPLLNCRIDKGVNPTRIICDSSLKIPIDCNIVKTAKDIPTIIATGNNFDTEKKKALQDKGVDIISTSSKTTSLKELIKILGERKIDSILIEGGSKLNYSALLSDNIVNKIHAYIAPKILGGFEAKTPVQGRGIDFVKDALLLELESVKSIGNDILIEYNVSAKKRDE